MGGFREGSAERKKWLGGYVREGKRGKVFVIERWLHGVHFHVSTRCRTERAALAELAVFEADPAGYRPQSASRVAKGCVLTPELVAEYERYQLEVKRTTKTHAADCQRYLEAWMHCFAGRDLRRLDLHADIKAQLDAWQEQARNADPKAKRRGAYGPSANRKGRIVALKGFTKWLRQEKGLLKRNEDPTLDLQVPQSRPEKLTRKKVVEFSRVEKVLAALREDCRDTLMVLAGTGLHISEVRRFALEGELFAPGPEQAGTSVKANLAVKHKTGRLHVVALQNDDVLDAAKRIRASRWVPSHSVLWHAMRAACDAAGVERFNAGVMRHSVATWLHQAGVPLQAISDQLGHRDPRTTNDFYREMGQQARALPMPHLKLVK
jgi:integrase